MQAPDQQWRPLSTLCVCGTLMCSVAAGVAWAGDVAGPRHVVRISGTADHGFHVRWSDGRQEWTPTLSETRTECMEYDTVLRRGRCTAAARARYRWMGVLKRSLRATAG